MTGLLGLHGGGEFEPGDEPFLEAVLRHAQAVAGAAAESAAAGAGAAESAQAAGTAAESAQAAGVVRIVIVPTASARGRPDIAGALGVAALERVAGALRIEASAEVVRVQDAGSAADPELARRLAAAHLIHLPGGDPDLIAGLLPGTAVWMSIMAAVARGAVLVGASAGAMGLASWTWTPEGGARGLAVVPGPPLVVMPHADGASWPRSLMRFGAGVPEGVGILGIAEHTGVLIDALGEGPWRVVGEGEVRWSPTGANPMRPAVYRDGDAFRPSDG